MGSIKSLVSEPIEDHEEYHIMVKQFFLRKPLFPLFWVIKFEYLYSDNYTCMFVKDFPVL